MACVAAGLLAVSPLGRATAKPDKKDEKAKADPAAAAGASRNSA